jgi:serine/threonine protein kinase
MSGDTFEATTSFIKLEENNVKKYLPISMSFWIREFNIISLLNKYSHPNIVKITECKIVNKTFEVKNKTTYTDNFLRITMDKYNRTLFDYKNFTEMQSLQIIFDIVSSIAHLHLIHIIHRDVKQDNILLTDDNRAILIDFSHSNTFSKDTKHFDHNICTYTHRPPEVFAYRKYINSLKESDYPAFNKPPYNEKIDIWSIGIIFFELVVNIKMVELLKEEKQYEKLFTEKKEKQYIKMINDECEKSTYIHKHKYIEWINILLSANPENRPTALELLKNMTQYIKKNNIPIKIELTSIIKKALIDPTNYKSIKQPANYQLNKEYTKYKISKDDNLIKNSILIIKKINKNFSFKIEEMRTVFDELISKKILTNESTPIIIIALLLWKGTIQNDIIYNIDDIFNTINFSLIKDENKLLHFKEDMDKDTIKKLVIKEVLNLIVVLNKKY